MPHVGSLQAYFSLFFLILYSLLCLFLAFSLSCSPNGCPCIFKKIFYSSVTLAFAVVSSLLPCLIPHCYFLDEDFKASLQLAGMPLETQGEPSAKARQHVLNKNRKELLCVNLRGPMEVGNMQKEFPPGEI